MNIILICGQGELGKSTYGQKLAQKLGIEKTKLIDIDDCVYTSPPLPYEELLRVFINEINQNLVLDYDNLICIAVLDSGEARQAFFRKLNIPDNTNLIVIHLRPPIQNVIEHVKQDKPELLQYLSARQIKEIYNSFKPASLQEFDKVPVNDISIYLIDNYNHVCLKATDENCDRYLV